MPRPPQKPARRGYTLLELLLALSLTAVVLLIISMGVSVQMRAFNNARSRVERAQLARVLLHRMADDLRGALPPGEAASSGTSTNTSASGSSGGNQDTAAGTSDDSSEDETSQSETTVQVDFGDDATTSADTTLAGVYGEFDWLRIDVARAVRSDTTSSDGSASADSTTQAVRQIETIVYYVVTSDEANAQTLSSDTKPAGGGLVRRELARPMATWAAQAGALEYRDLSLAPLASEVTAVEFRYHDGSDWFEAWDTATTGKLPRAIEIRLFLSPIASDQSRASGSTTGTSATSEESPDVQYRLIVPMPFEDSVGPTASGSSKTPSTESSSEANTSGDSR